MSKPEKHVKDYQMTEIERVGDALRKKCLDIFGATWSYDVAWRLARAAIDAMPEPREPVAWRVRQPDGGFHFYDKFEIASVMAGRGKIEPLYLEPQRPPRGPEGCRDGQEVQEPCASSDDLGSSSLGPE